MQHDGRQNRAAKLQGFSNMLSPEIQTHGDWRITVTGASQWLANHGGSVNALGGFTRWLAPPEIIQQGYQQPHAFERTQQSGTRPHNQDAFNASGRVRLRRTAKIVLVRQRRHDHVVLTNLM